MQSHVERPSHTENVTFVNNKIKRIHVPLSACVLNLYTRLVPRGRGYMFDQTILMESEVCICVCLFYRPGQGSGQNSELVEICHVTLVSINGLVRYVQKCILYCILGAVLS